VVDADALMDEMVKTARERTLELGKIEGFNEAELNQLFEVLGIGAIKYFLLKVDPKKRMLFNPEESIDMQGNTATAIQYGYARIQSIGRKAKELGIVPVYDSITPLEAVEKSLLVQLNRFADVVKEAAANYSPALVANYLYDLVREYNQFFAELSIFKAETAESVAFRVGLSLQVGKVVAACGNLLGIQMPERM
jgi:arginyl-tRNA synthetase